MEGLPAIQQPPEVPWTHQSWGRVIVVLGAASSLWCWACLLMMLVGLHAALGRNDAKFALSYAFVLLQVACLLYWLIVGTRSRILAGVLTVVFLLGGLFVASCLTTAVTGLFLPDHQPFSARSLYQLLTPLPCMLVYFGSAWLAGRRALTRR